MTLVALLLLVSTGCAPAAARGAATAILTDLATARAQLLSSADDLSETCAAASTARVALFGQPGADQLNPPWRTLRLAADSLTAACGQLKLAAMAASSDPAMGPARQAWQRGATEQLAGMCTYLRQAARELDASIADCG